MRFIVLWHHTTGGQRGMEVTYQTTDIVECTPEALSEQLDSMRHEYLQKHGYKSGWYSDSRSNPTTVAHQLLLLP